MKFKDCLWKETFGKIELFHTKSAYSVELDRATIEEIFDMCNKSEDDLTKQQKEYYQKLAEQGIMEPGIGNIPEERSDFPLTYLEIEISARCNLTCKHCFAVNTGQLMPFNIFEKIIYDAKKLGVIAVTLNGGETFLHPKLIEMIRKTRGYFRVDLFTNGTLITKDFCQASANLGIDKVFVSLDGFKDDHELVRGKDTFSKTIRGIKLLRKYGIRVWVTSVVHKKNEARMREFQKFCEQELKVNGFRFIPVIPLGNAKKNMELFSYPQKTRDRLFTREDHQKQPQNSSKRNGMMRCKAGITNIYIGADGGVYPCNDFRKAGYCLGNVQDKNFYDIYTSQIGIDSIFTNFEYSKLQCNTCSHLEVCGAGCRARALLFTGNVYGKDPGACKKWLGV